MTRMPMHAARRHFPQRHPFAPAALAVALALAGCATPPTGTNVVDVGSTASKRAVPHKASSALSPDMAQAAERVQTGNDERLRVYKGSGIVVKGQQQGGGVPPAPPVQQTGSGVVLNFEGAELREVVRNILGDILNESYTIDPAVGGTVTIRTTTGIPREALPATLETLLRANGITMIKENGLYKIVPAAAAVRGNVTPQLGSSQRPLPAGYSIQIVPLKFVGVRDMLRILEPFAKDAQAVRADEVRNLLILAGTERELQHLLEAIDMFDIDWMKGMSAGIFTLQNADVKTVMGEFEKIFGNAQQSPLAGIVRVVPIERMNAILVISPQPAYIDEAKKWIDRLDQGGGGEGPRLYVYYLQNSRAERVGGLLQQAFTGRTTQPTASAPTTAPGTPAGTIVSPPAFGGTQITPSPQSAATAGAAVGAVAGAVAANAARTTPPGAPTATGPGGAVITGPAAAQSGIVRNLVAVPDKDNNTIVIVATPAEYQIIEQALKKLDVAQRQVMIEVTVAEVVLTDNLQFGVEWLFKGGAPSGNGFGGNVTKPVSSTGANGVTDAISSALSAGFSYLISNSAFPGGIQAALRLLDTYGNTKVVANPHLAAVDNQKATIKVGSRIPLCQSTFVGGTNNAVTTTSQYIDTGVLVQVTPHINQGGLVTLDVQAEVSNPGNKATTDPCEAPPINTRSVQTLLSVPSGQTMVMGGLIQDNNSVQSTGLPLLNRIPVLGGLFGNQGLRDDRTEVILFITPRVVETQFDVKSVIDDLRRRMDRLDSVFPGGPEATAPQSSVAPR